jgi:hypothetical protein
MSKKSVFERDTNGMGVPDAGAPTGDGSGRRCSPNDLQCGALVRTVNPARNAASLSPAAEPFTAAWTTSGVFTLRFGPVLKYPPVGMAG